MVSHEVDKDPKLQNETASQLKKVTHHSRTQTAYVEQWAKIPTGQR